MEQRISGAVASKKQVDSAMKVTIPHHELKIYDEDGNLQSVQHIVVLTECCDFVISCIKSYVTDNVPLCFVMSAVLFLRFCLT